MAKALKKVKYTTAKKAKKRLGATPKVAPSSMIVRAKAKKY